MKWKMPKLLNFPMKKVKEGLAEIFVPIESKISKKLPVFYNPIMKLNRDITILLLKQFPPISLCDILSGSGIRAIRFAKELKYKLIVANDLNEKAVALIKKNMKHNKVKFDVFNKDANLLLLESKGFDFIDLDVFGSPNFLLNNAIVRLSREGILAVTATDTAALTGTYIMPCKRKYWAVPLRSHIMHEAGLRILIRKIQLIGAQYDKALIPIFSYSSEHYFRVFLRCDKRKEAVDDVIEQHGMFDDSGPMWLGRLWDEKLVDLMEKKSKFEDNNKFLRIIKEESKIPVIGFYDTNLLASKYKIKVLPKLKDLVERVKKKGFLCSETHFRENSIRTDISEKEIINILKQKD